jgi:hypothetical protein
MAKKRSVRKISHKRTRNINRHHVIAKASTPKDRSRLALRDLILSGVLSLICFVLYAIVTNEIYQNTFYLLSMILGFIAVAFLILYIATLFSRGKTKRAR